MLCASAGAVLFRTLGEPRCQRRSVLPNCSSPLLGTHSGAHDVHGSGVAGAPLPAHLRWASEAVATVAQASASPIVGTVPRAAPGASGWWGTCGPAPTAAACARPRPTPSRSSHRRDCGGGLQCKNAKTCLHECQIADGALSRHAFVMYHALYSIW